MSPKDPKFSQSPQGEKAGEEPKIPPMSTGHEPTPEELAAEESLLAEDLAAFEQELAALGFKAPSNDSKKPKVKTVSVPPPAPRIARAPQKKNGKIHPAAQAQKKDRPTKSKEETRSGSLDLRQVFSQAKAELLEAGIIPMGVYDRGRTGQPISDREAATKIMALEKPDVLALARILLTWKPEHVYNGQQIQSILRLIREGRRASIPHLLEAIVTNPSDVRSNEYAGEVSGGIRRKIRRTLDDGFADSLDIDPLD